MWREERAFQPRRSVNKSMEAGTGGYVYVTERYSDLPRVRITQELKKKKKRKRTPGAGLDTCVFLKAPWMIVILSQG